MKKQLLFTSLILISISVLSQSTDDGHHLSTNENFKIGTSGSMQVNSSANLFSGDTPFLSLRSYRYTGQPVSSFMTIRNSTADGQSSSDAVNRSIGFIMKLSSENSENESNKMGGLMLESSLSWANIPDLHLLTKNERRLTIKNDGKVGIGTTQPSAKLDVEGGDFYLGEKVNANGQRRQLRIYGYDNNSKFYGAFQSNYDDSRRTLDISSSSTTNQLKIDASSNPNARITLMPGAEVGVGIGTLTTGTHKLAVEGSIGAREIIVESSGWSDFVFNENHKLRTLEEVEKYIEEEGHLPEIPSEAEVNKNGINLGEMNAKLLQKIEELTLYMIDVNKRISHLEKENSELKENNQELRQKVKSLENE